MATAVKAKARRARAKAPTQTDLELAVQAMDLAFIQCRDFGHSWRPYTARWSGPDNCYVSELRCERCRSIRQRFLSRTGAQLGGHYDYPDNYLMPKGTGRLTGSDRDVIRLQSVLAVLPPDTAQEG